jgi:uncharacterized coiled-coil protein SlyX
MSHQFSIRSDDGLARLSVEALIGELESGMRGRGGNHMNITGMNLAIVKTLMNHINKLQDRIETLEGQMQDEEPNVKRNPEYETEGRMQDGEPDLKRKPTAPQWTAEPDNSDLARYEKLKSDLQKLYGGRAQEYDPTSGGYMFPPHGMCASDATLKMIDTMQEQLTTIEKEIARLEQQLKRHPYIAVSPHPMIILQPGNPLNNDRSQALRNIETRNQLLREIAKQEGERRILQEAVAFWSTVKPASAEYMQQVQRLFVEKDQLRTRLWEVHGLRPSAW